MSEPSPSFSCPASGELASEQACVRSRCSDQTRTPWEEQLIREVELSRCLRADGSARAPHRIGGFELLEVLGRGGFGVVFKARDPKLDRYVALKVCKRRRAATDEAKLLAQVSHPNVVSVYETGIDENGIAFFVMELVKGCRTGHELINAHPRPSWEQLVDIYRRAAAGLIAVHEAGIVHKDFKPANVLLDEHNWLRIADFGLAEIVLDHEGEVVRAGTIPFMAPEVLAGQRGDARSDQWSFCASLWFTLEGVPPYFATTTRRLLGEIERGEPMVNSIAVPQALREVLRRGLSLDPSERYPDMQALLRALDELREPAESPSEPVGPSESVLAADEVPAEARGDKTLLNRVLVLLASGLMLLLLGFIGGQLLRVKSGGGAFVDHVVSVTAGVRAVSLAREGDVYSALQLLVQAQLQPASESPMFVLAIASQEVAAEFEARKEWEGALMAWNLSVKFARAAGDRATERLGHNAFYEAVKHVDPAATPPPHRSR